MGSLLNSRRLIGVGIEKEGGETCVSQPTVGEGVQPGITTPSPRPLEPLMVQYSHYQLQCGCKSQYVVSQLTKGRPQRLN